MAILVGSARIGENGGITGGKPGDQKQVSNIHDTKGEVSMQDMYKHSNGWYILRPISPSTAALLSEAMIIACNNPSIGYNQGGRYDVVSNGVNTSKLSNSDCSSLVRACCKYAGFDPGNFNTASEASCLEATKLFEKRKEYISQSSTPVYDGDILVTKSKGHTVIVVSGNPRISKPSSSFYDKYTGTSQRIDEILKDIGAPYGNVTKRTPVANANGISSYKGSYEQNIKINSLAKTGKLKRV